MAQHKNSSHLSESNGRSNQATEVTVKFRFLGVGIQARAIMTVYRQQRCLNRVETWHSARRW